jgi:hypothetical protein
VDHFAGELDANGLCLTAATQRHVHVRPGPAAHLSDRFVHVHPARVVPFDLEDLVARAHAGARRRRARERDEHREKIPARVDLDADAAELPRGVRFEQRVVLGREVARVRVEGVDHAAHGAVDDAVFVHRVDVAVLDVREHLRDHAEATVGGSREGRPSGRRAGPWFLRRRPQRALPTR